MTQTKTKCKAAQEKTKHSKKNGCSEWPECGRLQHLHNEFGSKFSGSIETNKNTLDCIVLDFGQQRAYKLIFRTKRFLELNSTGNLSRRSLCKD